MIIKLSCFLHIFFTSRIKSIRLESRKLLFTKLRMSSYPPDIKNCIVLGSGSASRKAILTDAGIPFIVRTADIDERGLGDRTIGTFDNADKLVRLLGEAKADAILKTYENDSDFKGKVLVTSDTVVLCNNKILEKPDNETEARAFIREYGPYTCSTVGSIVVTDINTRKRLIGVDIATIYFTPIPDTIIDELIREGKIMYCAGALMIEHPLIQPYIQRIEGTLDSVMGLSVPVLKSLLEQLQK